MQDSDEYIDAITHGNQILLIGSNCTGKQILQIWKKIKNIMERIGALLIV